MAQDNSLIQNFVTQNSAPYLTNIGGGIAQIIQQKRAAEAARLKKEKYDAAVKTFTESGDPADIGKIYEADPTEFEGWKKSWDAQTELGRTQTVQNNIKTIGLIKSGQTDAAIQHAKDMAQAYKNDGDKSNDGDIKTWERFAQKMEGGDTDSVVQFLMAVNSAIPEGQKANEALFANNEENRTKIASEADLLKIANGLEWVDGADRARAYEIADGHNMETAKALIELSSITGQGGKEGAMTSNQFYNAESALRKEVTANIAPYRTSIDNTTQMERLLDPGREVSGMDDFAIIRLYNKALDPGSVVRESEAAGTAAAQGILDRAYSFTEGLKDGDIISPEGRADILAASKIISAAAKENIDKEYARADKTIEHYGFGRERVLIGLDGEEVAKEPVVEEPIVKEDGSVDPASFTKDEGIATAIPGTSLARIKTLLVDANKDWISLPENKEELDKLMNGDEAYLEGRFKGYKFLVDNPPAPVNTAPVNTAEEVLPANEPIPKGNIDWSGKGVATAIPSTTLETLKSQIYAVHQNDIRKPENEARLRILINGDEEAIKKAFVAEYETLLRKGNEKVSKEKADVAAMPDPIGTLTEVDW